MDPTAPATTKTHNCSALAAAKATAEVTEEEVYNGCIGANPRCCLDDTLLSLANGILHCLIVATRGGAAAATGSMVTATCSMPTINVVRFIGRED